MNKKTLIIIGAVLLIVIVIIAITSNKKKKEGAPSGSSPTGAQDSPPAPDPLATPSSCPPDNYGNVSNLNYDKELSQGSTGHEVAAMQRILNAQFDACLTVDGIAGIKTIHALSANLGVNSITLNSLYAATAQTDSTGTATGASGSWFYDGPTNEPEQSWGEWFCNTWAGAVSWGCYM